MEDKGKKKSDSIRAQFAREMKITDPADYEEEEKSQSVSKRFHASRRIERKPTWVISSLVLYKIKFTTFEPKTGMNMRHRSREPKSKRKKEATNR